MKHDIDVALLNKKERKLYQKLLETEYALADHDKDCVSCDDCATLRMKRHAYHNLLAISCEYIRADEAYTNELEVFNTLMNSKEELVEQSDGSFKLEVVKKKKLKKNKSLKKKKSNKIHKTKKKKKNGRRK